MTFKVKKTSYGVTVTDTDTREAIAVETEDLNKLIQDLSEHLPSSTASWDDRPEKFTPGLNYGELYINDYAMPMMTLPEDRE